MTTATGSVPYRVSYPAGTSDRLRRWAGLARGFGFGSEFLAAVKVMDERLHYAPTSLGEEQFDRHGMNATQFLWVSSYRVVYFAVHKIQPVVLVQQIQLTPGSRLADVDGSA